MTHDKARDFFSAYHEGSLEAGLRISFEQKLSAEADLRAEYDRFVATLEQLSSLREVQVEVPHDLNERIAARLDKHLWEQKQAAPKPWMARFRLIAFSGAAVVLLAGAAISLRNRGNGPIPANVLPIGSASEQLSIGVKQDGLTVEFAPQTKQTVAFRMEPDTKPFAEVTVDRTTPLKRQLLNRNPETDLVSIQVLDAPKDDHLVVAIPGERPGKAAAGSGTLEEFAKVLATRYRVPVVLSDVKDPLMQVTWDLDAGDARHAAEAALKGQQLSVDSRDGGMVTISRS